MYQIKTANYIQRDYSLDSECYQMKMQLSSLFSNSVVNIHSVIQPMPVGHFRLICTTLSEYLLHNSILPVASSIQYYFLPGEHHVPANMLLQDLCNFSRI